MDTAIKHPVPDRVKSSFVIFTLTLRAERQSARMSKITNDVRLHPVWQRMLYSCTHVATVGVKGLKAGSSLIISCCLGLRWLCYTYDYEWHWRWLSWSWPSIYG